MEDRAKLEAKYATSQLKYTLLERTLRCAQYDMEMSYVILLMKRFVNEVIYTIDHGLSLSIVSHLTYNLILVLARTRQYQEDYLYVIKEYLIDERFNTNANIKDDYEQYKDEIEELINKLESNNSFETISFKDDESWSRKDFICEFTTEKTSLLNLEKKLAYLNGPELLCCLRHLMNKVYGMIIEAKNATTYVDSHIFGEIYEKNYLLYAKEYWPEEGKDYRSHVEHKVLLNKVTEESLRQIHREIIKDFETNKVGIIWEYSEDKARMGYELKRIAIDDEQWKYFFKNVFRLEEIERWIGELRSQENGGSCVTAKATALGELGRKKKTGKKTKSTKARETMTLRKKSGVTKAHLTLLYQKMAKEGWIEGNEVDFKALFSGRRDEECELTWSGKYGKGTLVELFKQVIDAGLVELPAGYTLPAILEGHFKDKDGHWLTGLDKGNSAHAQALPVIKECVDLLKTNPQQVLRRAKEEDEDSQSVYDSFDHQDLHLHKR